MGSLFATVIELVLVESACGRLEMWEMMKNEKLAEKAYRLAFEYEKIYHGCAQCVVAAVQDTFGLKNDDIFKAVTGCGGGGGGLCDSSCGAYVGGNVMLSWLIGRERSNFDNIDVSKTYELVRKLHKKFIEKYGCIICRDINMKIFGRPYYTADPDEYRKFQEDGSYTTKCTGVVGDAAKWVTEIIIQENLLPEK